MCRSVESIALCLDNLCGVKYEFEYRIKMAESTFHQFKKSPSTSHLASTGEDPTSAPFVIPEFTIQNISRADSHSDYLCGKLKGEFILRDDPDTPGQYYLDIVSDDGRIRCYHVLYIDNKYTIDEHAYFNSLTEMMQDQMKILFGSRRGRVNCIIPQRLSKVELHSLFEGEIDGSFIMCESLSGTGEYMLAVMLDQHVTLYSIVQHGSSFYHVSGTTLRHNNLSDMIEDMALGWKESYLVIASHVIKVEEMQRKLTPQEYKMWHVGRKQKEFMVRESIYPQRYVFQNVFGSRLIFSKGGQFSLNDKHWFCGLLELIEHYKRFDGPCSPMWLDNKYEVQQPKLSKAQSDETAVKYKKKKRLSFSKPKVDTEHIYAAAYYACNEYIQMLQATTAIGIAVLQWKNEFGETPIMAAAQSNSPIIMKYLIDLGFDINAATRDGLTALHISCHMLHLSCISILVLHRATLTKTKTGETPLSLFLRSWDRWPLSDDAEEGLLCQNIKQLVYEGSWMVKNDQTITPLDILAEAMRKCKADEPYGRVLSSLPLAPICIKYHKHAILGELIDYDGRVKDSRCPSGLTLLAESCKMGCYWCVKVIVDKDASVILGSPLSHAIMTSNEEIISVLLEAGALIDRTDEDGNAPIHVALEHGTIKIVQMLIDTNAPIDVVTVENDESVMHIIMRKKHVELLTILHRAGAVINIQDNKGYTPLHAAVENEFIEGCEALIQANCQVDLQDYNGNTALHLACTQNSVDIIDELNRGKPKWSISNKLGVTPLDIMLAMPEEKVPKYNYVHICVQENNIEALKLFIAKGFPIDDVDDEGQTTFQKASDLGFKHIEKVLFDELNQGKPKWPIKNKLGVTPLDIILGMPEDKVPKYNYVHICVQENNIEALKLFIAKGFPIDDVDEEGKTPFQKASDLGSKQIEKVLCDEIAKTEQSRVPIGDSAQVQQDISQMQQLGTELESQIIQDMSQMQQLGTESDNVLNTNQCVYANYAHEFKSSMDLAAPYFEPKYNMCYCTMCHSARGSDDYSTRGDPPKLYGIPIGWYKYALKLPSRLYANDSHKTWHRAFHGTKLQYIAEILKVGELVPAGRAVVGGTLVRERKGHYTDEWKPSGFDTKQIFVSPSIKYAALEAYASSSDFQSNDGTNFKVKVAFQIYIHPESYHIDKDTMGLTAPIDNKFSNDEIEWSTNQQGSTILAGLLVNLKSHAGSTLATGNSQ